jgi:hypothetical protein
MFRCLEKRSEESAATSCRFHLLAQFMFLLAEVVYEFVEDDLISIDGVRHALMKIRSHKDLDHTVAIKHRVDDESGLDDNPTEGESYRWVWLSDKGKESRS